MDKAEQKHDCTIILDTNQFIRDFTLSETRWKNLIDYIHKTNAVVKMPRVVWDEIGVNYTKRISEYLKKAKESTEQFNSLINIQSEYHRFYGHHHRIEIQEPRLSPSALMERYLAFVKATLNLKTQDFLEIEKHWYEEIYKRSLVHKKPFSTENDKGFKDSILWKCVLSLASRPGFTEAPVILITSNSRDFGDGKQTLHPDLQIEARTHGLNVHFFDGLDNFFREWGAKALDINFEKLKHEIPERMIKEALLPFTHKLMRRNERSLSYILSNTLILGLSFKVREATEERTMLDMSISGSITNSIAMSEYLDFSAEATFLVHGHDKKITIQHFSPHFEFEKHIDDYPTCYPPLDDDLG